MKISTSSSLLFATLAVSSSSTALAAPANEGAGTTASDSATCESRALEANSVSLDQRGLLPCNPVSGLPVVGDLLGPILDPCVNAILKCPKSKSMARQYSEQEIREAFAAVSSALGNGVAPPDQAGSAPEPPSASVPVPMTPSPPANPPNTPVHSARDVLPSLPVPTPPVASAVPGSLPIPVPAPAAPVVSSVPRPTPSLLGRFPSFIRKSRLGRALLPARALPLPSPPVPIPSMPSLPVPVPPSSLPVSASLPVSSMPIKAPDLPLGITPPKAARAADAEGQCGPAAFENEVGTSTSMSASGTDMAGSTSAPPQAADAAPTQSANSTAPAAGQNDKGSDLNA